MVATIPPEPQATATTTRRVWRRLPPRAVLWFDWRAGHGVTDGGVRVVTVARPPVGVLLDATPPSVEIVNLTGGRPGDGAEGFHVWRAGALPFGWSEGGHFLKRLTMPLLRFERRESVGRPVRVVEVQRAAAWFGDGDYTVDQCAMALEVVGQLLTARFGDGVMRVRPAVTGQECFLRGVPDEGWSCVPSEVADLVRTSSGQGRIEHVDHGADTLPSIVEYDMRFAYAALCRELPGGPVVVGRGDGGFDPMVRGRFRCEWQVPAGWAHLGLLPMKHDDGATWCYPRTPGERGAGWVDAVELHLARRRGWRVNVLEHVVWPYRAKPLDRWARQLVAAYMAAPDDVALYGYSAHVAALVRAALRNITLHTLGAFYGRPYEVTHTAPLAGGTVTLPPGARGVTIDGDTIVYSLPSTRGGPSSIVHPEWPATVWARCRARMLSAPGGVGALAVPFADVIAVHTDALYLTADPRWRDSGDVGALRHKNTWRGPHPATRSDSDLVRTVRTLRKGNP